MEKEQVIEKLEEVFLVACDRYKSNRGMSIGDVISMGEIIIKAKSDVMRDVRKAEQFIGMKIESLQRAHKNDLVRITKDIEETLKGNS